MKVGTDGVLLGAWAKCENPNGHLLDIGTGTGLIALMCAQRFPNLTILGIEAELNAAQEAAGNVKNSPFFNQIEIKHQTLQQLTEEVQQFDSIVCNPPFFEGVFEENSARKLARHIQELPPEILIDSIKKLLTSNGIANVIYPFELMERVEKAISNHQFYVHHQTQVWAKIDSIKPERVLIAFGKEPKHFEIKRLVLEEKRHIYSNEYKQLTELFYLEK